MMVVVSGGNHVETHEDVEGQREHRQIPAAVDGGQCTGHNRTGGR